MRVGGGNTLVGAFKKDLPDMRVKLESRYTSGRIHRSGELFVHLGGRQVVGRDEGHANLVEARRDRDWGTETTVSLGAGDFLIPVEYIHPHAIDCDFELLTGNIAENAREVAGHSFNGKHVVTIRRKLMLDQHAAARSKRQAFDVEVL